MQKKLFSGSGRMKKSQRRTKSRLYYSAKITDRRFRMVLGHFVRESTVAHAAKETGLSQNSVSAIFGKLRKYFYDCGFFRLPERPAPDAPRLPDMPEGELSFDDILEYHRMRIAEKRGVRSTDGPDYHLAESMWRYDYRVIMLERPSDRIYEMMTSDLLQLIRLCGPVGKPKPNKVVGIIAYIYHSKKLALWLQRNVEGYEGFYDVLIEDERRWLHRLSATDARMARHLSRYFGNSVFDEDETEEASADKNLRFR